MRHLTPSIAVLLVATATACGTDTESGGGASTVAPATTAATETTVSDSTVPETTTTAPADTTTTAPAETTTTAPADTTTTVADTAPDTTAAPPEPTTPPPPPSTCDVATGSAAFTSITVDLLGDGSADDLLEGFVTDAGNGALRLTTGAGQVSTYVGSIEDQMVPIDVVDVFPGGAREAVVNLGGGDVAFDVALFTTGDDGCLSMYSYADRGGEEARFTIQPSGPVRAGAFCSPGAIDVYGAEVDVDGTWIVYGAAYEPANPTQLQYLGASDSYAEGVPEADIGTYEFDCLGVVLR